MAGHDTSLPEARCRRRDDGSRQAAIREVAQTTPTVDWPTYPLQTPSGGGLAPTPDRSKTPAKRTNRKWKEGLTNQGPLQKHRARHHQGQAACGGGQEAILDGACARRSGQSQVGTKECQSRSNKGIGLKEGGTTGFRAGHHTSLPEARSRRRDDGSGQAAIRELAPPRAP